MRSRALKLFYKTRLSYDFVATGPLVALFNPKDNYHSRCLSVLKTIREPLLSTVSVLTEY
jgi:hypothetical protein